MRAAPPRDTPPRLYSTPEQGDRDGEQGGRSGQRPVRLVVEPVGAGAEPGQEPPDAGSRDGDDHDQPPGAGTASEGHRRTVPTAARIASASRATGHHAELLGRLVQEHRDSGATAYPRAGATSVKALTVP